MTPPTAAKTTLCEEVSEELARILEGSAAPELYDHIAECDACRDLRHDASRAVPWIAAAGADYQPPKDLDVRILAAIDDRAPAADEARSSGVTPTAAAPAAPAGAAASEASSALDPARERAPETERTPEAEAERPGAAAGADAARAPSVTAPVSPQGQALAAPAADGKLTGAGGEAALAPVLRWMRHRRAPVVGLGLLLGTAAAAGLVLKLNAHPREVDEGELARSAPWAGQVASIARSSADGLGGAERCDAGGTSCSALASGAQVQAGSVLRTDKRTRLQLRLADGSEIVLDHDSELLLRKNQDRAARLLHGALVADVSHVEGDAHARIDIPGGQIEVLGTKFAVHEDGTGSRVEVTRGLVRLTNDAGREERVAAGEEGRVAPGKPVSVTPSPAVAEGVAWSDRSFHAAEEPDKGAAGVLRGLGELRGRKPGQTDERDAQVRLARHNVTVRIVDNVARTEIDESFQNDSGEELEGIYRFPLPPDAQVERLALEVGGKLEEGAFVEKDRAAAIWRGVIQHAAPRAPKPVDEIIWVPGPWRDPALLEWKRGGRFELKIFPIPAHGARRVVLAYTQTVPAVGSVRRYTYPLPYDPKGSTTVESFHLDAQVLGNDRAAGVRPSGYALTSAPSKGDGDRFEMTESRFVPSGDLTLEYALPNPTAELTAWAYQPPGGAAPLAAATGQADAQRAMPPGDDGSAYVVLSLRPTLPRPKPGEGHDQVLMVDVSRSMVGERYARARAVVKSMIHEMDGQDRVTVLACDTGCRAWPGGLAAAGAGSADAADRFLAGITPDGATDMVAMVRAAREAAGPGRDRSRSLHLVYVGDGSVSAGPLKPDHLTAEVRRVLPPGEGAVTAVAIGADADTTLLAALARGGGGVVVPYVPGQRTTEAAVSALAATYGATLRQPELTLPAGFTQISPTTLDTVRAGAETLVVARMNGAQIDGEAVLRGKVGGDAFEQRYPLRVIATSDRGNAFVPRLYAASRIADLERAGGEAAKSSIVDLSKRFSVASRYTSLLVLESEAMLTAFGLTRAQATPSWTGDSAAVRTVTGGVAPGGDAEGTPDDPSPAPSAAGGLGAGFVGHAARGRGDSMGGMDANAYTDGPPSLAKAAGASAVATAAPSPMPATPPGFAEPVQEKKAAPRADKDDLAPPAARRMAPPAAVAAPPFDPPPPPPDFRRSQRWVPMKKVWDRKGAFVAENQGFHDRDGAKIIAAEGALSAQPDSRRATRELYGLYAQHGRLDRASELAERWASRDALDPEALVARSDLAARAGDRELSVRILGGVVDVRPDDAAAQSRLATLYELSGQRARGCAHRVANAEEHAGDALVVAAAVRCARAEGMTELADRIVADFPADKRALLDRAIEKEPADGGVLRGDVRMEATWDADVDLDVALIDKNGSRLSWMGGGKAVVTAHDASRPRAETLALQNLGSGTYVVEVTRTGAAAADPAPVHGSITLRVVGETRVVPFTLSGGRAEVGRVEVSYTSRLVPAQSW